MSYCKNFNGNDNIVSVRRTDVRWIQRVLQEFCESTKWLLILLYCLYYGKEIFIFGGIEFCGEKELLNGKMGRYLAGDE